MTPASDRKHGKSLYAFSAHKKAASKCPANKCASAIPAGIRNMDDQEAIKRKLAARIGRAVISHLRKANKQLVAHAVDRSRSSQILLVILINEHHDAHDSALTVFAIQKALSRFEGDVPIYESIDAVLYLTGPLGLFEPRSIGAG